MSKKLAILCLAALGAALLVLGIAPAASAYPELTCQVDVAPQTLRAGHQFTVTGSTPIAVDAQNHQVADADSHWTFTWNGDTKTRTGRTASATFTAPHVTKTRVIVLTARNVNPISTCVKHFDITVIGPTSVSAPHGGSGLPETGGPTFWLLVAGLVLLLGGGGAVAASRRSS
ncbi:LPXTG-motif cell wall-anchored protein [Marmoricola sp. URHA0025 HA25]